MLVLGGTGEARAAAALLAAAGVDVLSSLAGRVRDPLLPPGRVRVGGFGGARGLAAWLRGNAVSAVLDATHPFAAAVTANAAAACAATGVPYLRLQRPPWEPGPGDRWTRVGSLAAAADEVAVRGGPVLLTVGRQGLAAFLGLGAEAVTARVIDPPDHPLPATWTLLRARGPFTVADEEALLAAVGARVLVTKNSGGEATAAKLEAAARLGVEVVMVGRPPPPAGVAVAADPAAAVRALAPYVDFPAFPVESHPPGRGGR